MSKEKNFISPTPLKEYWDNRKLIAIDPGKAGGIIVYDIDKRQFLAIMKMPETHLDIHKSLKNYRNNSTCYIEHVQGIPGMGASQMFTFGQGYGWLEMALLSYGIPTHTIRPQVWQKELGTGVKGKMSSSQWKKKLKAKAQQLFPQQDNYITLETADAFLIAEYARIKELPNNTRL